MNQKKLVILLSCIAGGIVILGVVIALLLSPITSFLHGGTGDDFRNVGSCAGKTTEPEANVPDNVFITPGPDETPHADVTPSNPEQQSAQPTEIATPEPTIDPYEALYERADTSMMKDIVNVFDRNEWTYKLAAQNCILYDPARRILYSQKYDSGTYTPQLFERYTPERLREKGLAFLNGDTLTPTQRSLYGIEN